MAQENRRFCKKCLLEDMDSEAYYDTVYEYINSLPPEQKAEPEEYGRRLDLCRQCNHLTNGLCRHCGCFVEVRAAKKQQYCPDPQRYW